MNEKDQQSEDQDHKGYPIICSLCGAKARVPFRPRKNEEVFCPDCFKFKRKDVNRQRQRKSPRKKHGTRVMFPIVCAQCGREETLDYVPKGVAMDEVLCSECVRTTYGDESRWSQITEQKQTEQQGEWEFECAECGRQDYLKFPPKPDKDYLCVRCYNEQESPNTGRLRGKKRVGRTVYIRKSDDDS